MLAKSSLLLIRITRRLRQEPNMVIVLLGIGLIFFFLPAILGTLAALAIASFIAGPIIVIGLFGCALIARSIAERPQKETGRIYVKEHKCVMVNWAGQKIPLGVLIYSIISSIIIAPILIVLFILFCPAIIAIPLVFITIGVEIGRYCGHRNNKPGIKNPGSIILFKGKDI